MAKDFVRPVKTVHDLDIEAKTVTSDDANIIGVKNWRCNHCICVNSTYRGLMTNKAACCAWYATIIFKGTNQVYLSVYNLLVTKLAYRSWLMKTLLVSMRIVLQSFFSAQTKHSIFRMTMLNCPSSASMYDRWHVPPLLFLLLYISIIIAVFGLSVPKKIDVLHEIPNAIYFYWLCFNRPCVTNHDAQFLKKNNLRFCGLNMPTKESVKQSHQGYLDFGSGRVQC